MRDSTVGNGIVFYNASDGCFVEKVVSFGDNPAIYLDAINGAHNHNFEGGSSTNRQGALDVINGRFGFLHKVQIEHGLANTELNEGNVNPSDDWDEVTPGTTYTGGNPPQSEHQFKIATNDQTYGAMVITRGADYPCVGWSFMWNNFGAGPYVTNSISLNNSIGCHIDCNYFYIPKSGGYDLHLDSACRHNIVGFRNNFRGSRSRAATGAYTDASRLMLINIPATGGERAQGTKGVWHPGANVLGSLQNTWAINGLEMIMMESGECIFQGGLQSGSTTGSIGTFLEWCRPHVDQFMIVISGGTTTHILKVATTGVLSIIGTLPSATLDLSTARFMAVLNSPYDSDP